MEMTLAKALRAKNRLANKLESKKRIVQQHNSYVEGNEPNFKVLDLMEEIGDMMDRLVQLKTAISLANKGIAQELHDLEEAKSFIKFLATINTREGEVAEYGEEPRNYVVTIKDINIADMIEAADKDIEEIQEKINQFNYNTKIELSFDL